MNDLEAFENSVSEIQNDSIENKWSSKRKTAAQMLEKYKSQESYRCQMDFSKWLPSLAQVIGYLIPGEMLCMLADTGGGKTAFMQQMILKVCAPLKTVLFEMELPDDLMMKRYISMANMRHSDLSKRDAMDGKADHLTEKLSHLITYSGIKFNIKDIEEVIDFEKPDVVIIDYMGIIRGDSKSRYEKLSDIAEELKLMALTKDVIMIASCQIHRDSKRTTPEIFLHDARDSSSIENSAQKMIGIWREGVDGTDMKVKVLKNQGMRDMVFTYRFNNESLNIWQG